MLDIFEKTKNILSETNPKYWGRRLLKEQDLLEKLYKIFPSYTYKDIPHIVNAGYIVEPKCEICEKPVTIIGKRIQKTCSYSCSSIKSINDGRLEKMKNTMIERYGVDNPAKSPEKQQKRIDTIIERYGGKISDKTREKIKSRVDNLNKKGKETLKKKYGVDNPGQLPNHGEKSYETHLKNHGGVHYTKTDEYKNNRKNKFILKNTNDTEAILDINEANSEYAKLYPTANDRISFSCNECDNEEILPSETFKFRKRVYGVACSKCCNLDKGSIKEQLIADFVENLGVTIIRNDRNLISPYEIDIVIPEKKIAIEFNGLYWHSEPRKNKDYHLNKWNMVKDKGYKLIQIFEDEWDFKREIVENRIKHLLGMSETIGARKTKVIELTTCQARDFVNKTHLQGYVNSSIKIGLEYNGEIVSVMTFSRPNKAKGHVGASKNDWELSRFCSSIGIVGGANKLLKYFIKKYKPISILSYSDNRWGDGKVYDKLGMNFEGNTICGYWYINGNERIHRYNFTKQKLIEQGYDPNKTEFEIMQEIGYNRIWDCGHGKWIWREK